MDRNLTIAESNLLKEVLKEYRKIRDGRGYGKIEIVIQDGKIMPITSSTKIKIAEV